MSITKKHAAQVLELIYRGSNSERGHEQAGALFAALYACADAETLSVLRATDVGGAHLLAYDACLAYNTATDARTQAFKAALAQLDPEKFGPKPTTYDTDDDIDSGEAKT
jgi:hypothetical protein